MTAQHARPTMSIRQWLGLGLLAVFLAPVLTIAVIGIIVFAPTEGPTDITQEIGDVLVDNAARWEDPAWQAQLRETYGDDADIVLMEGDQEIFRTGSLMGDDETNTVRKITIPGSSAERSASISTDVATGPPEELRQWFVPVALLTVLVLTLAGIAWFLRRSIVVPLIATSDAAYRIAQGEMDISLPPSRVREVALLAESFEAMSADLRRSLEQQAKVENERRQFISAIAHDLRTPLFSLRGALEGLRKGIATTPEQQRRYLDITQAKADQLERLIADLFTFTRMEYMGETPEQTRLELAPFLRTLVDSSRPRADDKGITLVLNEATDDPVVNADAHLLTRALENILDNALRHTPQDGMIRLDLRERDTMVEIVVTDSGPGFDENDLPHLFEPLYRGEGSRNRKTGGAGLGLTIAQRIIIAHGGTLTASNAHTGGAQVTARLPV